MNTNMAGYEGFQNVLGSCAFDESSLSIERFNPSNAEATLSKTQERKISVNHLNTVMLVFIR